jgi:hypothetical protein
MPIEKVVLNASPLILLCNSDLGFGCGCLEVNPTSIFFGNPLVLLS